MPTPRISMTGSPCVFAFTAPIASARIHRTCAFSTIFSTSEGGQART
jgi:hypothetical protein